MVRNWVLDANVYMGIYSSTMKRIVLPIPDDLLGQIDALIKGTDEARTVWIRRAIELRLFARNLTNGEINRLLDDWETAVQGRVPDNVDRGIAGKLVGRQPKTKKGARRAS